MRRIGYFMGYNEMVLGIYSSLYIVTHHTGSFHARRHSPCIGIGLRYLLVRMSDHCGFYGFKFCELRLHGSDLLAQARCFLFSNIAILRICCIQ